MERNLKGQFTSNVTSEDKVKIWELTPKGVKWAIIVGLTAIGVIYLLSSCQTTHAVGQSVSQTEYVKGDTTVKEISIKYEQTGKMQR